MTAPLPPLMGLPHLMTLTFQGTHMMPLAQMFIDRATHNPHDANAMMDLSTVLFLQHLRELGLHTQEQALQISRLYEQRPVIGAPRLRVLAIMTAGDLMTNAPLPFLLDGSDVSLSMLYVLPGEPVPTELPPHDVLWIAVSESDVTARLLADLGHAARHWNTRLLNPADKILCTGRGHAFEILRGVPGLTMPATARVTRNMLTDLAGQRVALSELLSDGAWPLIVRPVDSHAGHDLHKIDDAAALVRYLEEISAQEFYLSRFIDYRSADGQFRKYRVVLVDGQPFAGHLGVSSHWMVHYLNAGMTESADKRADEARFMAHFEQDFAVRHAAALQELNRRFGLDYVVIDCAETPQGELLVFEVDPGAVIHAMDPPDIFPYKQPAMRKVRDAVRAMLARAAQRTVAQVTVHEHISA